jgi:hypothetical protein
MVGSEEYLRGYLQDKYPRIRDVRVTEGTGQPYPGGRTVLIDGPLVPDGLEPLQVDNLTKARAIANAFLQKEQTLWGPISLTVSGFREATPRGGDQALVDEHGYYNLVYDHYLRGIKLDGTTMEIQIGPNGWIERVSISLVPIERELLYALLDPFLSEKEIRTEIEKDLLASGKNWKQVTGFRAEKRAMPVPPYLIWKVELAGVSMEYTIDAFTGAIKEKQKIRSHP